MTNTVGISRSVTHSTAELSKRGFVEILNVVCHFFTPLFLWVFGYVLFASVIAAVGEIVCIAAKVATKVSATVTTFSFVVIHRFTPPF